ncbi:MAG TPA: glycosyltransferase [Gemmatimonadaceae bacterium]|jgi:cellulose synthase/poly-beta-1,6-N-acetylglucosamine synthase-like glycosyltransferase|nr:glycosyltransferase [Gemmatimonadaceae bacterium]
MQLLATSLVLAPGALFTYAYAGYPTVLWMASRRKPAFSVASRTAQEEWPLVTLTVPVYNEERNIRAKLDDLLGLDYPADRLHILVISDASTDATERIVAEYADRGVELLRLPHRRGKTAAENAAAACIRGTIVVNSDATVRLPGNALRALVRAFDDPTVGVASGRDVSVGDARPQGNRGESEYVGYEMWVRALETRVGSIVGASGCFYGIRARIYDAGFPEHLSRDFASALMARSNDLRAVSVDDALCYVPRAGSLQAEFRRKIRTMARGLETLWQWRRMMNPRRYGSFAFMLFSHKLCRWLVYLSLPFAAAGLVALATSSLFGAAALAAVAVGTGLGAIALRNGPESLRVGRAGALLGFAFASMFAGVLAWVTVLRRRQNPVWEPTRRPA